LTFAAIGALYVFSGLPPTWYGYVWPVLLVGLAAMTDVRVAATHQGLRRSRLWWSTTIEWSDVQAVECRIKKPGEGSKASMLTVEVWRHSRRESIAALTTPETWSVAFIRRTRARAQATDLTEVIRTRGIPARVREWPAAEDHQAVPARWW
jgi:hypothetical protein